MHEPSKERLDSALSESLRRFGVACGRTADETYDLVMAATRLGLADGKRLRARLFYWGWRAADRLDCDEVIDVAIAMEIFHLFALVHDDLMDKSPLRRGVPTAHQQLARMHMDRGWRGDPTHFGLSSAMLLGDALLVWADMVIDASPLLKDCAHVFRRAYDEMRLEVMGGQYLDICADCVDRRSMSDVLRVARLKSGNYTISQPLRLGAIAGGAPDTLVAALAGLGRPLGEAFQIHDDIQGVFGQSDVTGKPVGDDIRNGKRTVLIAVALARCNANERTRLESVLGAPNVTARQVNDAGEIIRQSGALEVAQAVIVDRLQETIRALRSLAVDNAVKYTLADIFSRAVGVPSTVPVPATIPLESVS
ncbi:hypothetical protein A5736_23005 [Mycobacterium sp. SP-6446]|nr:hypothetical protein A5736_23005 [Mycobacterium sp. SP-6446]